MLKNTVFVWITLSALLLRDSTAVDRKDKQTRLASIILECKITENATESDLLNLKTTSVKSPAVKCLSTCISEKMGIITNHRLNPEGVMKLLRSAPNVTEKMTESVNEIINECKNIQDSDRCEYGSKIMDCINDGGIKRGIRYMV